MTQPDTNSENILIVDDEPENLTVLRKMLSARGYAVRPALNGEIALKAVRTDPPDIILLDVKMPGMDGYEVCKRLKSEKQTADIPVIFITVLDELTDKIKAFSAGGADYITKPIQEQETLARIRLHLDLKKSRDSLREAFREKEEANAMLKAIFNAIPDTVVTVDKNLNVINSNKENNDICHAYNLEEDGCGLSFQERLDSRSRRCFGVLVQTIETGNPVKEYEISCDCGTADRKVVLNTIPLIFPDSGFAGAVMVIRDITRLAELEDRLHERQRFSNIIGASNEMQKIYSLLEQTADLDINVLITGQSGTGKELAAEAIHYSGYRAGKPLIKVNCPLLPGTLLESELFGHVRGAFTGAVKDRIGRVQTAEGGTIFLDEIGDISADIQAKLLRFLECREYERLGDSKTLKADVRVITATNRNLKKMIDLGLFREDLYYRLKGMMIHLPPLKARTGDIPLLCSYFIRRFRELHNRHISGISDEVMKMFSTYSWPGNIRELKTIIEHACIMCPAGIIQPEHLPADFRGEEQPLQSHTLALDQGNAEKEVIIKALEKTEWNKAKAARLLGISRGTIYNKMLRYGIVGNKA